MNHNLPEQFQEFGEARRAGFLRVKELKERGRRVAGIFCTFTPTEILDAAGFTSVSLCGMSAETIPVAETRLPKNLCPLIKSSYGFALSDKCPYTYFSDLIVGETTCDGKKKMYELLNEKRPTYVLHLPQGHDGDPLVSWTKELRRFIAYLEETFGVMITEEALREAAGVRNAERRERLHLMELQKQTPPPMSGLQLYQTLEGAGFLFDADQRIGQMRKLRESVQRVADERDAGQEKAGQSADFQRDVSGKKRILITGCPIGGVLQKTVKTIEESDAVVVCFENCSGIKAAFQMVDTEAEDIVEAIAARYLEIGCSVMTPNTKRVELLERLIAEYQIDGIVEIDLQVCTPYTVESYTIRQLAKEKQVPYLAIETDYSQNDRGQLATRIEAFIEIL